MGDGVSATTLECWNIGNPRNSRLAPRGEWFATPIEEWPILLNCICSAGPVSKGSSIDVCGRPMNHFNGRSVAFHPVHPPSAAVFQDRQGEQIAQKAVDGKNCSHHTSKSLLSLYRCKKEERCWVDQWDRWQVDNLLNRGTLVVLTAQLAVDEGGKPITICKSIPESFSIISASSLLPHLALFSKMRIETYIWPGIILSRPHSVLCYSKEGLVLHRRAMNERRSWWNGWWIHEYLIGKPLWKSNWSLDSASWRSQL